jgi:hypothetical protein
MGFGDSWLISVLMRFSGNGAQYMNQLGGAAGQAAGKVDRITAAMTRLRNATTMIAGAMAGVGLAITVYGIKKAADFQLAMVGVQSATGASASQFARLQSMALRVSGMTAQSAVTIANEMYMVASSGLNNPNRLMAAFPEIAKAADVLWLSTRGTPKAVDPVDASMQMAKFSHLFGAYSGQPLHKMLDFLTRLMMVQPDSLSKAITQAKYFVPTAIAAGVNINNLPQSDLAMALASMGQTGLMQGRGGTGLARYIEYMMKAPTMTSHLSKNMRASMIDLGLFDTSGRNQFLDKSGNFELQKSLHYLGDLFDRWAKTGQRSRFIEDIYGAFLAQGGRYVATMSLPAVRAQQAQNTLAMQRIAPPGQAVEVLWARYMNTTAAAWSKFVTNLQNLAIRIFLPTLPKITAGLNKMADALSRLGDFFGDHPRAAGAAATGIMAVTGAMAARFVGGYLYKGLDAIAGFSGLTGQGGAAVGAGRKMLLVFDNIFTAGFATRLAPVFGRFFGWVFGAIPSVGLRAVPIVGWIAAIVGAINLVPKMLTGYPMIAAKIMNWWSQNQYVIGYTIGYAFGEIARMLITAIRALGSAVGAAASTFVGNLGLLLTPGGGAALQGQMTAAWQAALKNLDRGPHGTLFGGVGSGLSFGVSGAGYGGGLPQHGYGGIQITIIDKTSGGTRSKVKSHGAILTNPHEAGVLNLMSPSLGLHP